VVDGRNLRIELWWNDTDRGKIKESVNIGKIIKVYTVPLLFTVGRF
jgi:hypothetical protein